MQHEIQNERELKVTELHGFHTKPKRYVIKDNNGAIIAHGEIEFDARAINFAPQYFGFPWMRPNTDRHPVTLEVLDLE